MDVKIEKKRISILGCGWLGLPLAKRLLEQDIAAAVNGSTTSPAKIAHFAANGIKGYQFDLNPHFSAPADDVQSFFEADVLIISIPPRLAKSEPGFHTRQIEAVIPYIEKSPVREIIYISSTSVYPELNRTVTEQDVVSPANSPAPSMVAAENLLESLRPERTVTILRLGGLLGYERIPGKYVKGQKDMATGSIPVNYIHRDDAAGIIATIVQSGLVNETFNIVAPLHPTRGEVYETSCAEFGWEAPTFVQPETPADYKVISGGKFDTVYSYDFKFSDPLRFYYEVGEGM